MKKFALRLLAAAVCLYACAQSVWGAQLVVPGGQVIGLQILDDTVTIAAFDEELGQSAQDCGLQVGDRIAAINGIPVQSAQQVADGLMRTDGQAKIDLVRNGQTKTVYVLPEITENGPRLGVYLKQGITGVGTVTWYDPNTGKFGALGHGVNGTDGNLADMAQGTVYNATVLTVKTGKAGQPGQLMSTVTGTGQIGSLTKNTPQGVFGTARLSADAELLPIGSKEQVRIGKATIRSTVADGQIREYSVDIIKVYPNSGPSGRNMLLKVTDPALLNATGGIVQGMSGSPIIQDGKLVGAVTHVLVNDPTTGYGIFIENMLDAAA
ncbi:MAG: SpoIVB peptidase [Oscillospiraceae bacterium]|nr:SpoIVB peptidase [Oscillospiraceae bacterium]